MRSLVIGLFLFLVLGAVALYFSGIMRVDNSSNEVHISVDKSELKAETEEAIDEAKENSRKLLHRAGDALEDTGENLKQEAEEQDREAELETTVP